MKKKAASTLLALVLAGTVTLLPCSADAARMGGGRSFGSQPSMRAPAPRPAPAQPYTQQRPMQQPRPMNQPAQQRGGLGFGGGLLGGLLAGSVLGSLFGGGQGGQAAGEAGQAGAAGGGGIGLFDIILLFGGIWLLMRLFKRRQQPAGGSFGQQTAAGQPSQTPFGGATQYAGQTAQGAGAAWGALRGQQAPAGNFAQPNIPPDFNAEEFLRGAKMAYTRMQAAWDRRDIATIAQFATPAVVQELERQKAEDPNPSQTQILLVNASLQSVEEFGDKDRAAVYFDVVMREDPNQEQPTHAREIWTFVRQHQTGNWQLDGLQQVE